jgi:hypothetical protein
MGRKELTKLLARLFLSYFVLLAAFTFCGSYYAEALFPLFRQEVALLSSQVEVLSIGFEDHEDQQLISMVVKLTDPRINRSMFFRWPPMNLYLHPIIIFTMLFAWPRITRRDRVKLFAMSVPLLLILEMIDMPLVALSRGEAYTQALLAAEGVSPPLIHAYWLSFLSNGGREFLSVCTALLAIAMLYLLKTRDLPEPERNAPCPCGSGKKYKNCCMAR